MVLKSGTPIKKVFTVSVTTTIGAFLAGTGRQEPFTAPGVASGDYVEFHPLNTWPGGLNAGACFSGGTDLAYVELFNYTGSTITPGSLTVRFKVTRF